MTFPYREVLRHSTFANWGVLTEDPSDLSRASFGRTIEEKSPGVVVVSNGNKRERADCAFHSDETAFAYNQRKGEREEPNRAGTTTYRARVSLGKRDRSAPSFATLYHPTLARALHPSHCNRFYRSRRAVRQTIYLAKMPAKALCNVHSREYCAITSR